MAEHKNVLAYGEILWDLLPSGKVLGGAPANFAFRLSSFGVNVSMLSRVGDDALGREVIAELQKRGVSTDTIQIDPKNPTGTVEVTLSAKGAPSYVINKGVAYDFIEFTPELRTLAAEASVICYGTLVQREKQSRETLYKLLEAAPEATKLLDINLRKDCFSPETVSRSLEYADILKLNDEEVRPVAELLGIVVTGPEDFSKKIIQKFNISICLITKGERGVYARDSRGSQINIPGIAVSVVDTIGSGDAFTAGFLYCYLDGAPIERCCSFGNSVGAAVATTKGGMTALTLEEIRNFHVP